MTSLSKSEKSYIQSSLFSDPPLRLDGRALEDYRSIALETGIVPLANGSAKVSIGHPGRGGYVQEAGAVGGGTEVVVGVKLEVARTDDDGGNITCTVSCAPAAYPTLSTPALDDHQSDLTRLLESVLAHPSCRPANLVIVPGRLAWAVRLDAIVCADGGNVVDCLVLACRAALWDTRVPRTRGVAYRAPTRAGAGAGAESASALEPHAASHATDFELVDYWDAGAVLDGRGTWPVCVTLNVVGGVHFLDATLQEEAAVPLRMHVMYAFPGASVLRTCRLVGGEVASMQDITTLIQRAETYARRMWTGLEAKLKDEDARRGAKARDMFYGRLRG